MSNLNPQQFPSVGDTREIDGVVHHFAGWHASGPDWRPSADHEHEENMLGAEHGDVYVSRDLGFWGYPGDHAHEVWSPHRGPYNADQDVVPGRQARVGNSYPITRRLLEHVDDLHQEEWGYRQDSTHAPKWRDLD